MRGNKEVYIEAKITYIVPVQDAGSHKAAKEEAIKRIEADKSWYQTGLDITRVKVKSLK